MRIIILPYPESHLRSIPALSPILILEVRLSLHRKSFEVGRRQTMISLTGDRSKKIYKLSVLRIIRIFPVSRARTIFFLYHIGRTYRQIQPVITVAELSINLLITAIPTGGSTYRTTIRTQITVYRILCRLNIRFTSTHHACQAMHQLTGFIGFIQDNARHPIQRLRIEKLIILWMYIRINLQDFFRRTYTFFQVSLGIRQSMIFPPSTLEQGKTGNKCLHHRYTNGVFAVVRTDMCLRIFQIGQDIRSHQIAVIPFAVQLRTVFFQRILHPGDISKAGKHLKVFI